MKDYYKIGEISRIYGIGKDSLMYYEELGILKPTRGENGYRFYSLSDIWRLNLIKELRELDFPMKKIKEYLDDRNIASTREMLSKEIHLIDEKIAKLLIHKNNIVTRLANIDEVIGQVDFTHIETIYLERREACLLNANITRDEEVDFLIQKLHKEFEEKFYILGNNKIGAVFNSDKVKENIFNEFKSVFCLLKEETEKANFALEAGYYVRAYYKGRYKDNKLCIQKMLEYIAHNQYTIIGDPIEIYKLDIHESGCEEEFVTEVQIPISVGD